jgi:hypothetical protein
VVRFLVQQNPKIMDDSYKWGLSSYIQMAINQHKKDPDENEATVLKLFNILQLYGGLLIFYTTGHKCNTTH